MGKHSRRKRQRGGGKRPPKQLEDSSSSSSLLQKLRHADPRTRHAALAALHGTLLDPEQLSSSTRRVISSQLLDTVRERVMDDDLECAQAAAGCLANYVVFATRQDKDTLTAGWTLVFLERSKQCLQALSSQAPLQNKKQWLALTSECLHALVALIENNPQALERLNEGGLDLIKTMLSFVHYGMQQTTSASVISENEREYTQDITIYAVRTLHSAVDDNFDLLQVWLSEKELAEKGWNTIFSACTTQNLPLTARLHAAGCIIAGRQFVVVSGESVDLFQTQLLQTVVPLLVSCVDMPSNYQSLIQDYTKAQSLMEDQNADDAMERDVVQAVADKKEPGRLIARRQKLLKEQKKQQQQQNDGDDVAMEQDNDNDGSFLPPSQRTDAKEVLESAKKSWNAAISPLQLALELVANVTSMMAAAGEMEEGNDDDMDMEQDEIVWTAEQEAQLMAQQSGVDSSGQQSPLDTALSQTLAQSQLGNRLVVLLKELCQPTDTSIPADVLSDIEDLQSKCAACLGNCIGNLSSWQVSTELWKDLRLTAESSSGAGVEGVFDALAVAIRTRPELRKQIQADDLDFFMNNLSSSTTSDSVKGNVVCILGLLCSTEQHPSETNEKVCRGLLALLQSSSSSMVLSEVLNALMDMYGDDEVHPQVFASMDVLRNFQRMLPRFKKRIQAEKSKAPEEVVEQWRETALNASRFISYKKGQL